jgi:hypothetical protein
MAVSVGTYYRNMANLGLVFGKNAYEKTVASYCEIFLGTQNHKTEEKTSYTSANQISGVKIWQAFATKKPCPQHHLGYKKVYDTHSKRGSYQGSPSLVISPTICPV